MKSISIVFTGLAAFAAAAATSDKCATGKTPAKEELCIGFNNDFVKCQKETEKCAQEIKDKGQDFSWEKVAKCLEGHLPSASSTAAPPVVAPITAKDKPAAPLANKTAASPADDKPAAPLANKTAASPADDKPATTPTGKFKADLRVDTNRDGVIDLDGTSDQDGKDTWTDAAGAIFLPNIGDSGDRCKKQYSSSPSLSNQLATLYETLAKCHDAADDEQRAPQNMAPMRTVPIAGLSDAATGTISVEDEKSRGLVRIFREAKEGDGKWEIVNNNTTFPAEDLKAGLTLGVDARDTRRPDWDGRVKIAFTVRDGEAESTDAAMLRVAPVLLQHHRQPVVQVFTSDPPKYAPGSGARKYLDNVTAGFQSSIKSAGLTAPLTRLPTNDLWAQDYFEPAYASMPGPKNTTVAIRVVIEGRNNPAHNAVSLIYTTLRGDGVGAVAQKLPRPADLSKRGSEFDAGGNLETLPPYTSPDGKSYPAGRILVGGDSTNQPSGMEFFAAQEIQAPLVLDSTWLTVKHLDEMVQAVPAKTERGWAILAIDAEMGLKTLRDAQAAGLGNQSVMSRSSSPRPTIDQFLDIEANTAAAEVATKAMTANIELLKKETGLTDAEIHRVPAIITDYKLARQYNPPFRRRRGISIRDDAIEAAIDVQFLENLASHVPDEEETDADETPTEQRRQAKPLRHHFILPSLVNGVPLSDSHYLAPKPFGTIVDGKDIFEEAAAAAYKAAGFTTVDFLEEWRLHTNSGELHCMSNTYRETSEPWW